MAFDLKEGVDMYGSEIQHKTVEFDGKFSPNLLFIEFLVNNFPFRNKLKL